MINKEQQMSMYVFKILAEIKNQIENRLHCIDLHDDDCISIPYSCKNFNKGSLFLIYYCVYSTQYSL